MNKKLNTGFLLDSRKSEIISRRNFLGKVAVTTGAAALGIEDLQADSTFQSSSSNKLPREVWITTLSQMDLRVDTPDEMITTILNILKKGEVYLPDVVCLPEVFATSNHRQTLNLSEKLAISFKALEIFSQYAQRNNCYVICPIYTEEKGKIYNAAVIIDRKGNQLGEYRKMHLTENEMRNGITPGPLLPPVFKTDFGIIGVQICYDMLWDDGWQALKEQGAEIVFFPAAYAGGQTVNTQAWRNQYVVVSSTRQHTAKICDISGEVVAQTGFWDSNLAYGTVNLEKAFLHTWPAVQKFDDIRIKYGRKIKITNYHEEEWSIIESLDPHVFVRDILEEFGLKTREQQIRDADALQRKAR